LQVGARCGHRNITRHYQPADIERLAGDVPAAAIRMRCDKCQTTEWMRVTFETLPAVERQAIRMRRLTGLRYGAFPFGETSKRQPAPGQKK
jgi:hypothetical protein